MCRLLAVSSSRENDVLFAKRSVSLSGGQFVS